MLLNLRCPVCYKPLSLQDRSVRCESGHSFDMAKEGYFNLLMANKKKSKMPGDSKEMLQGRRRFLEAGYYQPLNETLSTMAKAYLKDSESCALDIGCGEGYFTEQFRSRADIIHEVWGLDVSKAAVQMASKKYRDCNFVVGSSQELPFIDTSLSFVFNINAPVHDEEIARVLKDEGVYIRVSPYSHHLIELKKYIYDTPKPHDDVVLDMNGFEHKHREVVTFEIDVKGGDVYDLLLMTPYYWHARAEQQQVIRELEALHTPAGFNLDVYKKSL